MVIAAGWWTQCLPTRLYLDVITTSYTREAKTVKDILPLVMDDGHFACYVQTNYDINAIASNTDDLDLQANLKYWEYNDDDRSALKADPLGFIH